MVLAAGLVMAGLLAAPQIELALATRTGTDRARLVLLMADPALEALCLDREGLEPERIEQARLTAPGSRVWLYLGSRRISAGRLLEVDTAASELRPCVIAGDAVFEEPIPLPSSTDVLWASSVLYESSPRFSVPSGAVERARRALPRELAEACLRPIFANTRGIREGALVGLRCASGDASVSALVFVPRAGEAVALRLVGGEDEGPFTLVEVLDPGRQGSHRVALARQVPEGRRLELWSLEGTELKRVDGWAD